MRELLQDLRKSSTYVAFFASSFVLMYFGVVMLSKFSYSYFEGFLPELNEWALRAVFYGLSILSVIGLSLFKKNRYSKKALAKVVGDPAELIKHLFITVIIAISISEVPLLCGFALFFLSVMYVDFYILSALTVLLIFLNIPGIDGMEKKIKEAVKA